jgi:hypothetical protein
LLIGIGRRVQHDDTLQKMPSFDGRVVNPESGRMFIKKSLMRARAISSYLPIAICLALNLSGR